MLNLPNFQVVIPLIECSSIDAVDYLGISVMDTEELLEHYAAQERDFIKIKIKVLSGELIGVDLLRINLRFNKPQRHREHREGNIEREIIFPNNLSVINITYYDTC